MTPNTLIAHLSKDEITGLIMQRWYDASLYRGFVFKAEQNEKAISLMYDKMHLSIGHLTVTDLTRTLEHLISMAEKQITAYNIEKALQRTITEQNDEQHKQTRNDEKSANNSAFARALVLRLTHDKGGKILDDRKHTIKNVMEAAAKGINYYTGNKI
jgi:hypothetical protein